MCKRIFDNKCIQIKIFKYKENIISYLENDNLSLYY